MKSIMLKACGIHVPHPERMIRLGNYYKKISLSSHRVPSGSFTLYPRHSFVMHLREKHRLFPSGQKEQFYFKKYIFSKKEEKIIFALFFQNNDQK